MLILLSRQGRNYQVIPFGILASIDNRSTTYYSRHLGDKSVTKSAQPKVVMTYLPVDAFLVQTSALFFGDAKLPAENLARGTDAPLCQSAVGTFPSSMQVGTGWPTSPHRAPVDHPSRTLHGCNTRSTVLTVLLNSILSLAWLYNCWCSFA